MKIGTRHGAKMFAVTCVAAIALMGISSQVASAEPTDQDSKSTARESTPPVSPSEHFSDPEAIDYCISFGDSIEQICGDSENEMKLNFLLEENIVLIQGEETFEEARESIESSASDSKSRNQLRVMDDQPSEGYIAVRWYEHSHKGGAQFYWGDSYACVDWADGRIHRFPWLGQYTFGLFGANNWNDTISSWKVYGGCRVAIYEDINFGGDKWGPYGSREETIPAKWNDVASALNVRD